MRIAKLRKVHSSSTVSLTARSSMVRAPSLYLGGSWFESKRADMIKVSKAISGDAAAIQEVYYRTWLETYPNVEAGITREDIEDRWKNRNDPERIERREREISSPEPGSILLLARDGEKIVGICRAITSGERNTLSSIYVLPEYQGQGIGNMLWREVMLHFDQVKDSEVSVATYNRGAIAFYQKLGFKDTGERFTEDRHRMKSGAAIPEMKMIRNRSEK